ncbi:hypothetical protein CVT25_011786 [Psilocybe cyanescens]|uniref:Uncharacterized protein n=1 Tax=Psilocybe cyanescens TaxID=93625 RepID=A0A409WJ97_PSICY|nr:hypothetical protein CVT25_011786 [Psilocybe cyanescens]
MSSEWSTGLRIQKHIRNTQDSAYDNSRGTDKVVALRKRTCDVAELEQFEAISNRTKLQHVAGNIENKRLDETDARHAFKFSDLKYTEPRLDTRKDTARAVLLTRKVNEVILYSSNSPTVPHILLNPPKETNGAYEYSENATPVQNWKYGDALVVPNYDSSRPTQYTNAPQLKDEEDPFDHYMKFTSIETGCFESDTGSNDSELSNVRYSFCSDSPFPWQVTFSGQSEYDDFPWLSTDLEHLSVPGYVSTYEFRSRMNTVKENQGHSCFDDCFK